MALCPPFPVPVLDFLPPRPFDNVSRLRAVHSAALALFPVAFAARCLFLLFYGPRYRPAPPRPAPRVRPEVAIVASKSAVGNAECGVHGLAFTTAPEREVRSDAAAEISTRPGRRPSVCPPSANVQFRRHHGRHEFDGSGRRGRRGPGCLGCLGRSTPPERNLCTAFAIRVRNKLKGARLDPPGSAIQGAATHRTCFSFLQGGEGRGPRRSALHGQETGGS